MTFNAGNKEASIRTQIVFRGKHFCLVHRIIINAICTSRPPLGDTPQDRREPIGSLAGSWRGCGQSAASLHNKRGRHSTHRSTLDHRPTCDQPCQKTTAIAISGTCCVQNLNSKSGHVKDGSLPPLTDKRTHSSQFHRDASVVCRRLLLYPFAKIYRVPNPVDLFLAGNECSDTFQETQVEVLTRVDVDVS